MKNLKYKKIKFIILFFLIVSSTQIIILPLSKIILQKILFYPLPEGKINAFIIKICDRNISKNVNKDSIIGYLCSRE